MWHDFEMSSEGCGSGKSLSEGVNAIHRAGEFLKRGKGASSSHHAAASIVFSMQRAFPCFILLTFRLLCSVLLYAGKHSCKVACDEGGDCTGAAPVKWHFHHNNLPPPLPTDCPGGVW